MDKQLGVMGLGMFGFVLAGHLAAKFPHATILAYDQSEGIVQSLQQTRHHPIHFQTQALADNVQVCGSLSDFLPRCHIIVLAIPVQVMRQAVRRARDFLRTGTVVVNVAKGLEIGSGKTISQVLAEELPPAYVYSVLSGGMIAGEILRGDPCSGEIACSDETISHELQELLSTTRFRLYRTDDVTGVEIAGALKNPLSIAAGIAHGLGFGTSTISALVSRGTLEIKRLALSFGAQRKTFDLGGQAALGDIMTSCFGGTRNRYFGELIAKEESVEKALAIMRESSKLVEGYYTARAVHEMAGRYKIDMPIQEQIFQILYRGRSPEIALAKLLARELKSM